MNSYAKTIEGRVKSLAVFLVLLCFLLVFKMGNIQIFKHEHYLALAQNQQRFEQTQMAERGKIYVHDSASDPSSYYPLAFDVKKFAVWAVPNQIKKKDETAKALSDLLLLPEKDIFDKINNDKLYIPALKRGLTLDEAHLIQDKKIAGVYVTPEYSRYYPEETLASQVLGFVNSESDGKYGFEGHYDNELKGKEGNVTGEKDTLGRIINLLDQTDPQNGNSYVLTIDRSAQYFIEKKLTEAMEKYQAESGTVIAMDIKTGGILAMASTPTFDPNNYRDQAGKDSSLFMNPAISYLFEPGSIFKPLVMAAALDKGLVTPDTESVFESTVQVQGYTIHTAEDKAFGRESMTQVLQNSDNVGMVWVANLLGNGDLDKYIRAFGLLDRTGIDLDTESTGRVPDPKQWRDINRATISFGQGISVTPMELLSAYAAIANGGKYIYPHIVDKVIYDNGQEKSTGKEEGQQVISKTTADQMKEMLYNVVMNGTAKKAQVPGFRIAAKTGTAQIAKPEGGYEDNDTKLGIYNHSSAGFAPVDDPQFALLVKLTKPKTSHYAESTAVPLFGEISSFLLNYHYRLKPTEQIK